MKHLQLALMLITGLSLITACNNSQTKNQTITMTDHQDSIKQWFHQYIDDVWNKGDFSHADKYWGKDFRNAFAPQFAPGPESMKKQVAYFLNAFSSFHFEIKDIMIDGDKISVWAEITGRHTGELFGIKPTNKSVKFRESAWYSMKNGKLDEVYPFVDWNSLFEQLGAYPKPDTHSGN